MTSIAYFSNQFADREGHGIARYAHELFRALRQEAEDCKVHPVCAWSSLQRSELDELKAVSGLQVLPWGRRLTPLAWSLFGRPLLEQWLPHSFDVVHALALGYPIATRKPYIVTVHDIGPLSHPQFFPLKAQRIMQRSFDQAIRRADCLVCVSNATAQAVMEVAGVSIENRIRIVHEGVSSTFFDGHGSTLPPAMGTLLDNDIPFLLATGKISPRKNTLNVIAALELMHEELPHHLVLAGGDGWDTEQLDRRLATSPIADRVHRLGYVSDNELRGLYRAASAFVYVSLFEGFGLPILEAMASGCLVIASDRTSLPEVAGAAALCVDPESPEAIANAILRVHVDPEEKQRLSTEGSLRAREFTWSRCARKVADIYRMVGN